jgi:hypothetical protein
MTWLTPALGAIVAAVAAPLLILLYFLKLRRRDLEVSSTFLWKKAIQDLQANAPFQRLRRNLLLFLQLLVLGGLCIALAQPQIKGQEVSGNKHVIMIDRSASMTALDEKSGRGELLSRLDSAKDQAIALVESLREGGILSGKDSADEAMVISFDTAAEIRQQFTTDKAALRRAIDSINPSHSPTLIDEAFRLGQAHKPRRMVENVGLEGGPPVTIHLYSDGRIPDAAQAKSSPDDIVEFHRIGSETSANIGIVGLRAAREYDKPEKLTVYVSLQSNATVPRRIDVELMIDGVSALIKSADLPPATTDGPSLTAQAAARAAEAQAAPDSSRPDPDSSNLPPAVKPRPGQTGVAFSIELPTAAVVQVRLREPNINQPPRDDVLEVDDRATLVIPPAKKLSVLVVSTLADSWIDVALGGLPLSRLTKIDPPRFEEFTQQGRLGEFDVIVLENWLPAPLTANITNPAADAKNTPPPAPPLPPGSYIIIGAAPTSTLGLRVGETAQGASVIDWSADHPALRNTALSRLRIAEIPRIETDPSAGVQTLIMTDEGGALFESSINGVHALILPFAIDKSNWIFDPGFVVFVGAAVRYMGEDVGAGSSIRDLQPGAVLTDRLPLGAADVLLTSPGGSEQKLLTSADGRITFGPLLTTGVYEVSWTGPSGPTDRQTGSGRATRLFAANLGDAAESDLAAAAEVRTAATVAAATTTATTQADRRLWPYLLLLALAIAMFEWFIYNRKMFI